MPNMVDAGSWLELAPGVRVRRDRLAVSASRAGGPGGQHVNTADTRLTLRVPVEAVIGGDPGLRERLRRLAGSRLTAEDELVLHCEATRSRARNRELLEERLCEMVARAAPRPKRRRPTRPTRAAEERRLRDKARRGRRKRDRRPPAEE